jgi:HlyD family secretion protein
VEYEQSAFEYEEAKNELKELTMHRRTEWQSELMTLTARKRDLISALQLKRVHLKDRVITAPVSGTIQGLKGLEKGNLIQQGDLVAEISPDSELMAECYVAPSDIGLLKKGNPVKFRISPYHHHYWGMATGTIRDIQDDVSWVNDRPVFKITCTINEKMLRLKDMTPGRLSKGMTLQARFLIAKRTALQLLSDRIEDWYSEN